MKILAVIDIDENHLLKETNKLYDLLKDYKCSLKPMPEKKERESWSVNEYAVYNNLHKMGWNDCINYILGETE